MNRIKTSQVADSLIRWMTQSIATGEPIPLEQVTAWRDALKIGLAGLEARETAAALLEQQKQRIRDRVPTAYAEQLTVSISQAVKRLANHAVQAATLAECDEIDRDASGIIDGFELLTMGVVRAETAFPNEDTGG